MILPVQVLIQVRYMLKQLLSVSEEYNTMCGKTISMSTAQVLGQYKYLPQAPPNHMRRDMKSGQMCSSLSPFYARYVRFKEKR